MKVCVFEKCLHGCPEYKSVPQNFSKYDYCKYSKWAEGLDETPGQECPLENVPDIPTDWKEKGITLGQAWTLAEFVEKLGGGK